MQRVVSIATYLKNYNISREDFDKEIDQNKEFYDKYINWGSKKDGTDSVISPRALEKLGQVFNENEPQKMTITIDGEVQKEIELTPEKQSEQDEETQPIEPKEKTKRKRRTKAEIEEEKTQMDMSDFMNTPADNEKEPAKVKMKETKTAVKISRKKTTKLNITKQFIQEHGKCNINEKFEMKDLRRFLINSGHIKIQQIAEMEDSEIIAAIEKDYYFINSPEGTYIIKRSALNGITKDVFLIDNESF